MVEEAAKANALNKGYENHSKMGENSSHNLYVKPNKKDLSLVQCFTCKEMGHYSWDCPEKKKNNNKMNIQN